MYGSLRIEHILLKIMEYEKHMEIKQIKYINFSSVTLIEDAEDIHIPE